MALPGGVGAALAADMGKNGLTSAAPAPENDAAPPSDDGDGVLESIISDIDAKVPGLGKLVHELVDYIQSQDEEQDADEG